MGAVEGLNSIAGEIIDVEPGTGVGLVELAETVGKFTDSKSTVTVTEPRQREVDECVTEIRQTKRLLGYEPTYHPQDRLQRSIEWYWNYSQSTS